MGKIKTTWSIPPSKLTQMSIDDAQTYMRKIGFEIAVAIISNTPVDKGTLRANWKYGTNAINEATTTSTDVNLSDTEKEKFLHLEIGDVGNFTNSLNYAYRIEFEGHSKEKAPQGMVRKGIAEVVG